MRQVILAACGLLACVAACNGLLSDEHSTNAGGSPSGSTTTPAPTATPSPTATPTATTPSPSPTVPVPVGPGPIPQATLSMASTWSSLMAGNYATSFNVGSTNDLLVLAKVDPSYQGRALALSFVAPTGARVAGYTATVGSNGTAAFDVKLLGTFVGRNALTGVFQLVLGDYMTQSTITSQLVSLTTGGAQ